ncbi:glycogen/starch synthase [Bacteroidales bacterium OttesenSCG-928-A17]|nr:glycogen/starch synthase [Bacteroidales bacterium OttesenSCG-928-A17]
MIDPEVLKPDYIFESSWEVCNKVGGIYTVLSTRAKTLQDMYKDKIFFIGPDLWVDGENPDFIENKTLLKGWRKQAVEKEQLKVRVGRWDVPGKPIAILVDFTPFLVVKNDVYFRMWERFQVDSIAAYGDYDESCMFAYAAGLVIESIYNFLGLENKHVIAHQNEWMLGMTGLYLRDKLPRIATVFTTHATSVGRSICGNGKPLYREFVNYNGDQMARELNMESKHSLEKRAAEFADCFTTVSELTAKECEQLLDVVPDIVTPNGFESNFVPKKKEFDEKRIAARKQLIDVASRLVGEEIADDALLLAISGRYEYKNKGLDLFIETMNQVKWAQPKKQIISFILVPGWIYSPRTDLQNRMQKAKFQHTPLHFPICTHYLMKPEEDKICNYLYHLNFLNQKDFKTKIIFVPCYLNGNDGIFDMEYYDLLTGFDLTVFPSYYEPWGYTPLESVAFGIPTITTNFAGFGLWARNQGADQPNLEKGVEVLERTEDNYFEVAGEMKDSIIDYAAFPSEKIKKTRAAAHKLSEKASWSNFIRYYQEAYHIALEKAKLRKEVMEIN